MPNEMEIAIEAYVNDRTPENLSGIDQAIVASEFHVPVFADVKDLGSGRHDIPVVCIRTERGTGAIPAFTTVEQLLSWKPSGAKYATLAGRSLLAMAEQMPEIDEIAINPAGVPQGTIPRTEFGRLISLT